jgi:hypothetical protein
MLVGIALACPAVALVPIPLIPSQASAPELKPGAIVAKASAYVGAYQQAFAFLVADETYVQQAAFDGPTGPVPDGTRPAPRQRVMRGELFLTYLGADRRWVALHDIAEVDGTPVDGRENLRALLAVSPVQSVAARLFRHNARYNIGTVARNFNEPTLALQVLESGSRSRFEFRLLHVDRTPSGPALVTLSFRERERPTIVRGLDGRPVFSTGELTVEADTGTIRRTRIAFRHESIDAELTATFAWSDRLDLWLPSLFAERYVTGPRNGLPAETITGEARYENYRRFEGTGRIAPPAY